jgi:hypothetical protein
VARHFLQEKLLPEIYGRETDEVEQQAPADQAVVGPGAWIIGVGDLSRRDLAEHTRIGRLPLSVVAFRPEGAGNGVPGAASHRAPAAVEVAGVLMQDRRRQHGRNHEVVRCGSVCGGEALGVSLGALAPLPVAILCLLDAGSDARGRDRGRVDEQSHREASLLFRGQGGRLVFVGDVEVRDDRERSLFQLVTDLFRGDFLRRDAYRD